MVKAKWIEGTEDITISFEGTDKEPIVFTDWYLKESRVESFEFADDTVWSAEDMLDHMGSSDTDIYKGFYEQESTITAREGHDIIQGYDHNDTIDGVTFDALKLKGIRLEDVTYLKVA